MYEINIMENVKEKKELVFECKKDTTVFKVVFSQTQLEELYEDIKQLVNKRKNYIPFLAHTVFAKWKIKIPNSDVFEITNVSGFDTVLSDFVDAIIKNQGYKDIRPEQKTLNETIIVETGKSILSEN